MPTKAPAPLVVLPCGCACTKDVDPCNCGGGSIEIWCRKKCGSYALCGMPEYTTPSEPPRFYLIETFSGSATLSCSSGSTKSASGTGARRYDTSTGSCTGPVETGVMTIGFFTPPTASFSAPTSHGDSTNIDVIVGTLGDDFCQVGDHKGSGGSREWNLTNEDTEDAAIARSGATWGPWELGVQCCAYRSARTGTSGSFCEVETKIIVKGTPGKSATVSMNWTQRAVGGGPTETSTTEVGIFVPFDGIGEQSIPVPTQSGFETCLASAKISKME